MIPQETIEQVRTATDIVDIIGQYLRVKKRGRNFLALCPFHTEKTPSFSISPDKQIYHCFGCSKGGNVFTFLMEHENMTFVEAVKFLAEKAGIRIREEKTDDRTREMYERLHYAHTVALEYFVETLYSDKYRSKILRYLHDNRKITDESIELFRLGLAGEEWDGFLNFAQKKDLFPKELHQAGLLSHSEKKDRYFDRFRQRLMIPIFNLSGKPIAFGGRALAKGENAKYINSPETPLYNKSTVLYGLNFTKENIRKSNEVIVVEGYFDLISLWQAGVKNVVASSGTAFTSQQARLLARFAEKVYLFFDADSAGQNAAVRSVDSLYDAGLEVMVMSAPEGEDPDSVAVREGHEGIMKLKEKAKSFIKFVSNMYNIGNQNPIAKSKFIDENIELILRIEDFTKRKMLLAELSEYTGIRLEFDDSKDIYTPRKKLFNEFKVETTSKSIETIELELIYYLLNNNRLIEIVSNQIHPSDFESDTVKEMFSIILSYYNKQLSVSFPILFESVDDNEVYELMDDISNLITAKSDIEKSVKQIRNSILARKLDGQIKKLKAELKLSEDQKLHDESNRLHKEIKMLVKKKDNLKKV